MGLFQKKEEQLKSNSINIPLPPGSSSRSRFKDDFDHPFDINTPVSSQTIQNEGGSAVLVPTTLGLENKIDLGLPSFTTKSNHNIDLDTMEKELSLSKEKEEPDKEKTLVTSQAAAAETKEEKAIEGQELKPIKLAIKEDEINYDDIPDEIDDIPDFIPALDVEDETFAENAAEFLEEPKEKRSAYIGLNSILEVKKRSDEIKLMISDITSSTMSVGDNEKKERELISRSKSLLEDLERKILFINKVLFQEE